MIHGQAAHLLGGHVAGRAEHDTGIGRQRRGHENARVRGRIVIQSQFGQAKVENLDPTVPGDEDVLWLEIAMNDSAFVRCGEPVRDLEGQVDHLANRDRAAIHSPAKRLAFEHLGHDERHARIGADVVHRKNIGMVQRRGSAGFLLESMETIDVSGKRGGQHLDGDVAPEPRIVGAVDLSHSAAAQRRKDFVRAEPSAGCEGHE